MRMGKKIGEKESKALQAEAADTMLGNSTKFAINGLGDYEIRPLYLQTLIDISKEALQIDKPDEKATIIDIIARAESAVPASRIVAKAILQSAKPITVNKKLFGVTIGRKTVTKDQQIDDLSTKLLNTITPLELNQLVMAIINQSNAGFFFNCMTLLGSMRIMAPTT